MKWKPDRETRSPDPRDYRDEAVLPPGAYLQLRRGIYRMPWVDFWEMPVARVFGEPVESFLDRCHRHEDAQYAQREAIFRADARGLSLWFLGVPVIHKDVAVERKGTDHSIFMVFDYGTSGPGFDHKRSHYAHSGMRYGGEPNPGWENAVRIYEERDDESGGLSFDDVPTIQGGG